jgi:hypothetical protein
VLNEGYDAMDALISGVFMMKPVAQPTRQLALDMVAYQPTPARVILDLATSARFSTGDLFCDLGSGLGHVVMLVHLIGGVRARGIELEPVYCDYSRRCAAALGLSGVEFLNSDVTDASLVEPTHFFLYTPFTGHLLSEVLMMFRNEAVERSFDLFTYGPCTPAVAEQSWLTLVRVGSDLSNGLTHFRSTPPVDTEGGGR